MGISAGINQAIQPIEQDASSFAGIVGNIASQVASFATKTQVAVQTPISVTLPTTTTGASIGVASPSWTTITFALGAAFLLWKVIK
jgi:hypothetical protein